jgi:ketosteroid isomerase-like protein
VSEVDGFLADILPRLREAEIALHSGDADPRSALWSHDDPVTLFGAEVNRTGWSELGPTFDWLATRFTGCTSLEYEIVAAGVSGDLAYLVAIERISASANGDPASYALRATTIFRREGGVRRAVHPRPGRATAIWCGHSRADTLILRVGGRTGWPEGAVSLVMTVYWLNTAA